MSDASLCYQQNEVQVLQKASEEWMLHVDVYILASARYSTICNIDEHSCRVNIDGFTSLLRGSHKFVL